MKIVIDGDVHYYDKVFSVKKNKYIITKFPNISTEIYLKYEEIYFPDYKWTDLTESLLGMWTYALFDHMHKSNVKFTLYFMDGPYQIDIFKDDDMRLEVNCVHCKTQGDYIELTFCCEYVDFLQSLYSAAKAFSYLLYKNGMNSGKFEAIYVQSIARTNELKNAIAKLAI